MTRRYGSPKRTVAGLKAAMEARLIWCTDERLADITAEDMQRNGYYRQEGIDRLAAEKAKRGIDA